MTSSERALSERAFTRRLRRRARQGLSPIARAQKSWSRVGRRVRVWTGPLFTLSIFTSLSSGWFLGDDGTWVLGLVFATVLSAFRLQGPDNCLRSPDAAELAFFPVSDGTIAGRLWHQWRLVGFVYGVAHTV